MKPLTTEFTQQIIQKIQALPADADAMTIADTCDQLQAMNYQPMLLNDVPSFLGMTRNRLIEFIGDLVESPNASLTEQHLNLLLYHFRLLQRLRANEPEAWDEINELMEDD